jgi:16S rRNA (guanine(966)-N(2))-methyltransferase RsmD
LFSIWQPRIEGCRFLDLFAGSGAVGLEAISRGARRAVFVEGSARAFEALRRNVRELAVAEARLERARLPDGLQRLSGTKASFDVIFADPPYALTDFDALLKGAAPLLECDGEMAIEHSCRLQIAEPRAPWRLRERRSYGDSCVTFFRLGEPGPEVRGA